MKTANVGEAVLKGARLLVGEYRGGKAEAITFRDKRSGSRADAVVTRHTIECGNDSISVSEFNPDGVTVESFKPFAEKGQKVVVVLTELKVERGNITCSGRLERLE